MEYREYQRELDANIHKAWGEGARNVCAVLPTGGGKTVLFADVIRRVFPRRALVIAHREELIFQARDKIQRVTGLSADVEMGEYRADGGLFGAALFQRVTSVSAAIVMWLVARRGQALVPAALLPSGLTAQTAAAGLAGAGVLDVTANVLYGGASMQDLLSISSVLSSLYPVITVLMARIFLGERLARVQGAGVALALAGTTLIAAR